MGYALASQAGERDVWESPGATMQLVTAVARARQLPVFVVVEFDTAFGAKRDGGRRDFADARHLAHDNGLSERIADITSVPTIGHARAALHPHVVIEVGEFVRDMHQTDGTRALEVAHVRHKRTQMPGVRTVRDFHFPMLFGKDPIAEVDSIHSWI